MVNDLLKITFYVASSETLTYRSGRLYDTAPGGDIIGRPPCKVDGDSVTFICCKNMAGLFWVGIEGCKVNAWIIFIQNLKGVLIKCCFPSFGCGDATADTVAAHVITRRKY